MKTQDVVIAGGVLAAALFYFREKKALNIWSGDAERMSGVKHLYGTSAAQQQATSAAIAQSWKDTFSQIDATQPDWWI